METRDTDYHAVSSLLGKAADLLREAGGLLGDECNDFRIQADEDFNLDMVADLIGEFDFDVRECARWRERE